MRNERGFTLIELLIVLAILAILVGIVALSLNGITGQARTTAKNSEKEIVQSALDTFFTQYCGPQGATGGDCSGHTLATIATSTATTDVGYYLRRATQYQYAWDSNGNITTQQ